MMRPTGQTPFWMVQTVWLLLLLSTEIAQIFGQQEEEQDFTPIVNYRCERGQMTIIVTTQYPFRGVVHPRDFRQDPCVAYGKGLYNTTLLIELLANKDDPKYCGAQIKKPTSDKVTLPLAIRVHPSLELSEDKFFFLTCGKAGFRNARNEISRVSLHFIQEDKRVSELVYGHEYILRAAMTKPDSIHKLKVKSCLSFAPNNTEVPLIDGNGCPQTDFLTQFRYNDTTHSADATLSSMFRFPDSNRVHVQCDIVLCRGGGCDQVQCSTGSQQQQQLPQALPRIRNGTDEGQLMASTTVFVLDPGDYILAEASTNCTEWRFPWLIGLCICLAILLLVMLIVNIFLCSSLTCTCTKTEVMEKEPSEMEDYDPYRVGWVPSSQYGSRTSLHKPGYTSGGSTLNSTARSVSNASDHYAIVHSRPGSRYSQHSSKEPLHSNHRGPGSTMSNGRHSSRM